jgi:hypothetical protein
MAKSQNFLQKPERRPRGFSRYKRSETFRLVKGAQDAGLTVRGLEVDPATGVLRVLIGNPDETAANVALDASTVAPERIEKMKAGAKARG